MTRSIIAEKKRNDWDENELFITGGFRWGVRVSGHDLVSYCAGVVADNSPNTTDSAQDTEKGVTKPPDNGNAPIADIQAQTPPEVLLQKSRGGRPRKEGSVSRMTKWRRKQETQGRLV